MNEQDNRAVGPPPLDLSAVVRARDEVENGNEHDPTVLHEMLTDLLRAYDALGARLAWLSVEKTGGFDR